MATKVKIEFVCYGLPSDLGIPFPPLDLDAVIDFDAPSSPAGAFSWAATVQAEMGDPRPMTSDEIEDSLKILATMDCPGRSSRHQPRKISRRRKLARVQPSKEKCHQDGAKATSQNEQGGKMEKAEMARKRSPGRDDGSRHSQSTLKSRGNKAKGVGNKKENDGDIDSGWRNKAQPAKPPKPLKIGKKEGQRKMVDTRDQRETSTAHRRETTKATYTIEKKETDPEGREKADSNRLGMADTRERGRIKEDRKVASQIEKREKYSEGRKKAEPNRLEMAGTGGGGETKEAKKAACQIEKMKTGCEGREKAQPSRPGLADTGERGKTKEAKKVTYQMGKRETDSEERKKAHLKRLEMADTGEGGKTKETKKVASKVEKKETDSKGRKKAQASKSDTSTTTEQGTTKKAKGVEHKHTSPSASQHDSKTSGQAESGPLRRQSRKEKSFREIRRECVQSSQASERGGRQPERALHRNQGEVNRARRSQAECREDAEFPLHLTNLDRYDRESIETQSTSSQSHGVRNKAQQTSHHESSRDQGKVTKTMKTLRFHEDNLEDAGSPPNLNYLDRHDLDRYKRESIRTESASSRSQHGQGMKHKAYQTTRHQDPSSKDEGKGDHSTSRDKGVRKTRRRSEKSKQGIASTGFDKEIYEHIPIDRYHGETDIEYHNVSPLSSSEARPRDQASRKTRRRSKNNTNGNSKQEMGSVASLGEDKEINDEGLPHGLLQDATDLGYCDLGPSVACDHDGMSLMSVGSGIDGVDSACDFQPLDSIWEWSMATHNQPGFQSVVTTPDCPDFHPPDNDLLPDFDLYLQILSEHGRGFYDDDECNYTSSSPDIDLLYPDHAYLYRSNLPLTAT